MNFTYLIEGTLFALIVLLICLSAGAFFIMATLKSQDSDNVTGSRLEFCFYGVASLAFAGLLAGIIS